jgi:hypothetical protein
MHLPVRPGTAWARPLFVALIVLSLFASTGIALAAPAAAPTVRLVPPPAAIAAPSLSPATLAGPNAVSQSQATSPDPSTRSWRSIAPTSHVVLAVLVQAKPKVVAKAATKVTVSKPKFVAPRVVAPKSTVYAGVYHLWIPALGLSRAISDWGCRGGAIPDRVEYWGCAGTNNLYLLGHAYGAFAAIHDGYHSGALRVGLTAYFADKAGRTHRYRISEIRHVANSAYGSWSGWAVGATSGPVITLQTCDGATSAYRILVRLVPA